MNDEEYERFQGHPIQAFDPFYTRDYNLFDCAWDDYRRSVRRKCLDATSPRELNRILNGFVDTVQKIKTYERATDNKFISYKDSSGRMRQNRSYLSLLDLE